jgi:hypothetical protein
MSAKRKQSSGQNYENPAKPKRPAVDTDSKDPPISDPIEDPVEYNRSIVTFRYLAREISLQNPTIVFLIGCIDEGMDMLVDELKAERIFNLQSVAGLYTQGKFCLKVGYDHLHRFPNDPRKIVIVNLPHNHWPHDVPNDPDRDDEGLGFFFKCGSVKEAKRIAGLDIETKDVSDSPDQVIVSSMVGSLTDERHICRGIRDRNFKMLRTWAEHPDQAADCQFVIYSGIAHFRKDFSTLQSRISGYSVWPAPVTVDAGADAGADAP